LKFINKIAVKIKIGWSWLVEIWRSNKDKQPLP